MSALTPTQKINLRNGGALVTIKSDKTHRARKMLHASGHHERCDHLRGAWINEAKAERRAKRVGR